MYSARRASSFIDSIKICRVGGTYENSNNDFGNEYLV